MKNNQTNAGDIIFICLIAVLAIASVFCFFPITPQLNFSHATWQSIAQHVGG